MSLSTTPVHPEGPRYRAPLVFVPGLWSGPEIWQRAAGFLAHRGWEGWLVDPGPVGGGMAERARALGALALELGRPPVLIVQDAAGLLALEVARRVEVAAVVWVAPLVPAGTAIRAAVSPWRVLTALLFEAPVRRPPSWMREAPGAPWVREHEAAPAVVDVVRGRATIEAATAPMALVVGDADPMCSAEERAKLAARLGADVIVLPSASRAPLALGQWQQHAGVVHRWLVKRLGETLLELYDEAMAERDDDGG